jgi:hypothetical protein
MLKHNKRLKETNTEKCRKTEKNENEGEINRKHTGQK